MGRRRAFRGAALILSAALCCAGCGTGKTAEAPPSAESVAESINRPFDVAATIKMGGIEAEADLNRTENGVCTFLFHQPAALDGMTVTLDRDTIGLSYLGLSVEADSEKVLSSSVTKAIVASINLAAEPSGVTVGVDGSAILVSGKTDSGDFTLRLDQKNQSMLTLSIPSLDLECHFSSGK
ncbi:MAG: hypothetical protein ACOX64_07030 [Candidatus Merdivicinus sp.]|jgi:hypothetical protein